MYAEGLVISRSGSVQSASVTKGKAYDRLTDMSYGMDLPDAPKVLADILEATIGAVYVDCDYSLAPVFKVGTFTRKCPAVVIVHANSTATTCIAKLVPLLSHSSRLAWL